MCEVRDVTRQDLVSQQDADGEQKANGQRPDVMRFSIGCGIQVDTSIGGWRKHTISPLRLTLYSSRGFSKSRGRAALADF